MSVPSLNSRDLCADVVVAGLGTSGAVAALAAARAGARVIGIERDYAVGGTGTRAGIHAYYHGSRGGLQDEIDAKVKAMESELGAKGGTYHPEAKRIVLTRLLEEAGVQIFFGSVLWGVEMDGPVVKGIRLCNESGEFLVRGKVFIDTTGDGDLADAAGAKSQFGRGFDGASHQYSFAPRTVRRRAPSFRWEVSFDNYDAGWVDPRDPWDLTRALIEAREQMRDYFIEVPSRADGVIGTSSILGVREGRHIEGDHTMTFDDFLTGRSYPDVICTANSHYDNHTRDMANEPLFCQAWLSALAMYRRGVTCQIPFGCILAKGIDNLLVACRALSVDREVSMAVRMQRDMQKLGQAAGVIAAAAVRNDCSLRSLFLPAVQDELQSGGLLTDEDRSGRGVATYNFTGGPLRGRHLVAGEVLIDPEARKEVRALLPEYFGAQEEGKAFHWLRLLRDEPREDLLGLLCHTDYPVRRSAAFALGFMEDLRAEQVLLECLEMRDPECPPPDIKTYPRWVAALILLRMIRSTAALETCLDLLEEGVDDRYLTFLLAYLDDFHGAMSAHQRGRLSELLRRLGDDPTVGKNYSAQGERSKMLDIRWNIDLWVVKLLDRLAPEESEKVILRYVSDSRPFVRAIWQPLAERLPKESAKLVA